MTPDVLVPRWETEILIERFLGWARTVSFSEPLRILDMCTGSGNIAVVAAKELPGAQVTAVDISPSALAIAKQNASRHQVTDRIRFVTGDLFACDLESPFHAILSNPPYLNSESMSSLMPDVKNYEPKHALDGGAEGLHFIKRILPEAWNHLEEKGALFLEIDNDQAQSVSSLVTDHGGFDTPEVTKDYMGVERVVAARKRING